MIWDSFLADADQGARNVGFVKRKRIADSADWQPGLVAPLLRRSGLRGCLRFRRFLAFRRIGLKVFQDQVQV